MMSCTMLAAWNRPILSLCCTEYGTYHGAIQSSRLTSVAMYRSGQLGRRCIIETQCSGLHVCRCFSNARVCLENTRP
jgi:hypothetical protein